MGMIRGQTQPARAAGKIDVVLGQKVRDRRIELGLSQATLGALLGVSFQQIQKYERGVNRINANRLKLIASALDLQLEDLFVQNTLHIQFNTLLDVTDKAAVRLIRAYSRIRNKVTQHKIVELAEGLAGIDPPSRNRKSGMTGPWDDGR